MVLSNALTTMPGPASPPMASIEIVRARVTATFRVAALALRLHDFAFGIMTAGPADMMGALGLAAVGAVTRVGGRQGVVRATHVAARRRGFSFRDRHGGELLEGPLRGTGGLKQAAWVAGKPHLFQAKSREVKGVKSPISGPSGRQRGFRGGPKPRFPGEIPR